MSDVESIAEVRRKAAELIDKRARDASLFIEGVRIERDLYFEALRSLSGFECEYRNQTRTVESKPCAHCVACEAINRGLDIQRRSRY